MTNNYSIDQCHSTLMARKPLLSFDENSEFFSWREAIAEKLKALLGDMPEYTDPKFCVEWEKEHDCFKEYRFVFSSEEYVQVPGHLWIPKNVPKPCPVVVCMQGHSTGMHISMGKAHCEWDEQLINNGDEDFARQTVAQGFAALVIEQRAFGERKSEIQMKETPNAVTSCLHPTLTAFLLGRTMIGERVWDISRAVDILENFPEIDMERIGIVGQSGGGTATYYAACLDPRFKVIMPSGCVCTFRDSITAMAHCACNYIPGIAKYMDMGDLAALIAPRKLIVVAGNDDPIFPISGVKEAFSTIEKIYAKVGAEENCRLVVGEGAHRFYADNSWPAFRELADW